MQVTWEPIPRPHPRPSSSTGKAPRHGTPPQAPGEENESHLLIPSRVCREDSCPGQRTFQKRVRTRMATHPQEVAHPQQAALLIGEPLPPPPRRSPSAHHRESSWKEPWMPEPPPARGPDGGPDKSPWAPGTWNDPPAPRGRCVGFAEPPLPGGLLKCLQLSFRKKLLYNNFSKALSTISTEKKIKCL
uniref:Uncharacterized protein n=1 Tax=Rousettus aegyptiacus TaxID=9407 RepID=A0A7J8DY52_ROUAE|nr:hypothetical protein HJG63_008412 [Rousettus aegyptiacus]